MRYFVILALSFLCLTSCDQGAGDPGSAPERIFNNFPFINVSNESDQVHIIEVDYARGFQRLRLGEGDTFTFSFDPPDAYRHKWRDIAYPFKVAVYEYGNREIKCSSIITAVDRGALSLCGFGDGGIAESGNCTVTKLESSSCEIETIASCSTCQVELTILE